MNAILDPDQLSPEARACFTRIRMRLRKQDAWQGEYALGLVPASAQCAEYLRTARAAATLSKMLSPESASAVDPLVQRSLRLARRGLKFVAVLPHASLNAKGEDAVIATLCAPLPKLVNLFAAPLYPESA